MISTLVNWVKTYRVHFVAWAMLIAWETICIWILFNIKGSIMGYGLHYTATICVFYLNSLIIIPRLTKLAGNVLGVFVSLLVFFPLYILSHVLADQVLSQIQPETPLNSAGPVKNFIIQTMYRGLFFFGTSLGYYYLFSFINSAKKQFENLEIQKYLEQQLLTTQNLYLKAQINPHFLFNTLHFINAKLSPDSEASEAVLRLSKIMHFAFKKEDSSDKIRILEELMQIQELIALQELRGDTNKLELQYDLAVCNLKLIPLVLLTLAENIYKHGDLKEEPAILSLKIENDELRVSSKNKIQVFEGQSDQTGLENLKSRLIASYGKQTKFESLREQGYFEINIAIPVTALAS